MKSEGRNPKSEASISHSAIPMQLEPQMNSNSHQWMLGKALFSVWPDPAREGEADFSVVNHTPSPVERERLLRTFIAPRAFEPQQRSAGFPACGFWGLSSPQYRKHGTGMSREPADRNVCATEFMGRGRGGALTWDPFLSGVL